MIAQHPQAPLLPTEKGHRKDSKASCGAGTEQNVLFLVFLWVVGHLKTKLLLEEALYERFKAVQTV